jgi:LacI family transcriptional regulator
MVDGWVEAEDDTHADRAGRVTIVDVARRAGVSKSTVSLVVSGSSLVADATRERVTRAMSALGYIYHRGAATLRGAQSSILGMVINDLSNPFFVELAIGIERVCQSGSYVPFVANTSENPLRQSQVIRSMREHGVAGLVLSPAIGSSVSELNALIDGLPVVLAMRRMPGLRASLVTPENRAGARAAAEHLIGLGHRRIAFVGGTRTSVRYERLSGYRDALEEAGLTVDPALVIDSLPSYAGGESSAPRLLNLADPPTAALCFNDVVAIGLMRALSGLGRKVGVDFAVIGFDDIDEARHMRPALTSVAVGGQSLGERAAHLLMRQIAAGGNDLETQLGPATLVVRRSCGAHASNTGVDS